MSIWACPHCANPLIFSERSWSCANSHNFDCAKEGYVNLLPANKKRSKAPGDNPDMIAARRRIHEAAIYEPLSDALSTIVSARKPNHALLDIGCGEGYYNELIVKRLPDIAVYGIDIAKSAVRLAAKKYPANHYAVASSKHLPVLSASVGLVLQVFSPESDTEVLRVLQDAGYYLQVGPGPRHLWELRLALYDKPIEHDGLRKTLEGATLVDAGNVNFVKQLNSGQLRDLLMATPFAFRGHREKRAKLQELDVCDVTMAFEWRLFQKRANVPT